MAAPTTDELISKAWDVESLRYEAGRKELSLLAETIVSLVPETLIHKMNEDFGAQTIPSGVKSIAKNEADIYDDAIDSLTAIGKPSESGKPFGLFNTEVNNAADVLTDDNWNSQAADAFRENFLDAYPDIVGVQSIVVDTLKLALEGYAQALEDTYLKIDEALDATGSAYQGIIDSATKSEHGLATAILTTALGAVGSYITGGTALSIAFGLTGSGISIAASTKQIGGSTVAGIDANFHEFITELQTNLDEFDTQLAEALGGDHDILQDNKSIPVESGSAIPFEAPRPAFADDPGKL